MSDLEVPKTYEDFQKWLQGSNMTVNELMHHYENVYMNANVGATKQNFIDLLDEVAEMNRRDQGSLAPVQRNPKPRGEAVANQTLDAAGNEIGGGLQTPFTPRPGLEEGGADTPRLAQWANSEIGNTKVKDLSTDKQDQLYQLQNKLQNQLKLRHLATPAPAPAAKKEQKPTLVPTIKPAGPR